MERLSSAHSLAPRRYNPCSVLADSRSRLQSSLSLPLAIQFLTHKFSAPFFIPSVHHGLAFLLFFCPPTCPRLSSTCLVKYPFYKYFFNNYKVIHAAILRCDFFIFFLPTRFRLLVVICVFSCVPVLSL